MTIQTWNAGGVAGNSVPGSTALNNLIPPFGRVTFRHQLAGTAPVVGSWLGLIPRGFTGYYIDELQIMMPICDSGGALTWQLGTFVYDTGVMKTGDNSLYAGEQLATNGSGNLQVLLVNGQAAGTTTKYTAGTPGGSPSLIRVAAFDLLRFTPPFDVFSDSSLGIGLVCTNAPTAWSLTDAAPQDLIVSLSYSARSLRS